MLLAPLRWPGRDRAVPMGGCHPWLRYGMVAVRGRGDSQSQAPRRATAATRSEAGGGEDQMGPASAPDAVRHNNAKLEANLSAQRLYLRSQAWQPSSLSLSDAFEQLSAHISVITWAQLPQPVGFWGVALRGHFQRGELSASSTRTTACPAGLQGPCPACSQGRGAGRSFLPPRASLAALPARSLRCWIRQSPRSE